MYKDDDTMTPRDRISDEMLSRILGGSDTPLSQRDSVNRGDLPLRNENGMGGCGMGGDTWGLENHPLASVYAPLQIFRNLYDRDTALMKGTIFTELDLPFMGKTIMKGGNCRG